LFQTTCQVISLDFDDQK